MKALIKKDIASTRRSLIFTLIFSLAFGAYGIYNDVDVILIIPALAIMIPIILSSMTFGYDNKSNFEQFAFSMPIGKKDYVLSKLFFAFTFSLLGAISIFLILEFKGELALKEILTIAILSFIITFLFSAIQLPFILKYGEEKGRLIMIISYAIIFIAINYLKEYIDNILEVFSKYSSTSIGLGLGLVGLILIFIFIGLAIKIMSKKEF